MKIELNIETSQLGDTVIDLFNNLTTEQKQQVAMAVLQGWFQDPNIIEKTAMEGTIVNKLRSSSERENRYGESRAFRDMTDDEIRKTYRFSDEMKNFKSSKTIMVESIKEQMTSFFKNEMKSQIEKDSTVVESIKTAIDILKQSLPQIVAEAMIQQFTSVMMNQQYSLYSTAMRTDQLSMVMNQIGQAININDGQKLVDDSNLSNNANPMKYT